MLNWPEDRCLKWSRFPTHVVKQKDPRHSRVSFGGVWEAMAIGISLNFRFQRYRVIPADVAPQSNIKTVIATGNQLHGWKNFPAIVWWVFYWNLPLLILFPWKTASWRGFLGDFPIQTSIECGNFPWHQCTVQLQAVRQIAPTGLVFNSDQIRVKYTSNWTHIQIVRFPRLEIGSLIYLWYSLIYI